MRDIALIGKKIGMTREFYKTGQSVPVTVLKMEKARVIQVIDTEKRGYKAIQIGFGKIKNSKITKAMKGYFAKKNTEAKRKLKEFRVSSLDNFKEGNEFGLEIFSVSLIRAERSDLLRFFISANDIYTPYIRMCNVLTTYKIIIPYI